MLGEVGSLLPAGVPTMALTATATRASRKSICHALGMHKPVIVAESPNEANIKYEVQSKSDIIEETFASLLEELRRWRVTMDKTIIFCCSCNSCVPIYHFLRSHLNKQSTEPVGYPDLLKFRILEMFTACHTSLCQEHHYRTVS